MEEVPLKGEGLNKQEGSVWTRRGRDSFAMSTLLGVVLGRREASELKTEIYMLQR